jgi:type 1 glutamine amidotransferase
MFRRSAFFAFVLAATFVSLRADEVAVKPHKKILFFSKSSGWEHEVISYKKGRPSPVEKVLEKLGAEHGWDFVFSKNGGDIGSAGLKGVDAVFFYTSGNLNEAGTDGMRPVAKDGKQALLDFVAGGKGFVGVHSASDTWHTDNEAVKGPERFVNHGDKADAYVRMLGGEFIRHGAQQKARQRVVDTKFPGLESAGDAFNFVEEWYSLKDFSSDIRVLLTQETAGMTGADYARPPYPSTWIRRHGQGRVFYSAMGHREDVWTNPAFQNLLVGGIRYALGEVKVDETPNLASACPGWATNPKYEAPKKK